MKQTTRHKLTMILFVLLVGLPHPPLLHASPAATVAFQIDSATPDPGATITLPLRFTITDGLLGAAELEIQYDPTVIDATTCVTNPQNVSGLNLVLCNPNFNNDGINPDTIFVNAIASSGVSGNIVLADITFAVIGAAGQQSKLDLILHENAITDAALQVIPATAQDGNITIKGAQPTATATTSPAATPTPTPTPTATPVTPLSRGAYLPVVRK